MARKYTELLSNVKGIITPYEDENINQTFQSYVIFLEDDYGFTRDELIKKMLQRGIETQIGTYALHQQPCYKRILRNSPKHLNNSLEAFQNTLTLPMYHNMTFQEIEFVVNSLKEFQRR